MLKFSFVKKSKTPVYTKRLRLPHPLTPMMDVNAFYIEVYRERGLPESDPVVWSPYIGPPSHSEKKNHNAW